MIWTDIEIFNIANTALDEREVYKWMDRLGATEFTLPADIDDTISDGETLIGLAGKRCYNSFQIGLNLNITKVRADWTEYLDNILKSGHGSVLTHASSTYAIEGLTRVATAELNRHAAGTAISEASLRYIRFDAKEGIPFFMPPSIRANTEVIETVLESKKAQTRDLMQATLEYIETAYLKLSEIWDINNINDFDRKKQLTSLFRRIIPMGVSVGVIYTWNFRAIRHILTLRGNPHAEEEVIYIASLILKDMMSKHPKIMGDFYQIDGGYWVPKYLKV